MDITPIVNAVIALVALLITAFVIPWLKKKAAGCDMEKLLSWVNIAVAAAEQLYTTVQGDEKKQYALDFLKAKGYEVDSEDINNAIEAAVLELHNALYGTEKVTT